MMCKSALRKNRLSVQAAFGGLHGQKAACTGKSCRQSCKYVKISREGFVRALRVVDDDGQHNLHGAEAVIDKDLCSALLAENLEADLFIIATDVSATFVDWGKETQKAIASAHPDAIEAIGFAAGSMGPKVQAAINFARHSGRDAVIGSLSDIVDIVKGKAGTRITTQADGISYY